MREKLLDNFQESYELLHKNYLHELYKFRKAHNEYHSELKRICKKLSMDLREIEDLEREVDIKI